MSAPSGHHALIVAAGSSRRLRQLTRDRPKCLVEIGGRPLITYSLDALAARGVRRLTIVVGYQRERLMRTLGERYGEIRIDYAVSEDYATTEHGWSLYQTRASWSAGRLPVLFLDADDLYHPALLDRVLDAGPDTILVDRSLPADEQDEELVLGSAGRVSGLQRGRSADLPGCVGGFVGVNRFSAAFMETLYAFMEDFFARHGHGHKYERIFDALVTGGTAALDYVDTGGLPWVNVNHEHDLERAQIIAGELARELAPDAAGRATPHPVPGRAVTLPRSGGS